MRSVSVFLGILVVVASLTTVSASAEDGKTDVISMGKNSTALVTTRFGSATAFCIDPAGCFVTNHHAVKVTGLGNRVKLTMHSGEDQEQTVEAEVIAWSEADDLAILETKGPTEFASLALGETESLYETQRLSAFGYPFGDKLAVKENTKPTISVNGGSISALRKNDGVLEVIQVDIALNPGNSGGPVLDKDGRLVGIVKSGIPGASVNFLIPVEKLKALLAVPQVFFAPPRITTENARVEHNFSALAGWMLPSSKEPLDLQLEFEVVGLESRRIPMTLMEGAYRARTPPIAFPGGKERFAITAEMDKGSVRGTIEDFSFLINGETFWLHDVASLEALDEKKIKAVTKKATVGGTPRGLNALALDLGGVTISVDAMKVNKLQVAPAQAIKSVLVGAVAMSHDRELARVTYSLVIDGPVVQDKERTTVPPSSSSDRLSRRLYNATASGAGPNKKPNGSVAAALPAGAVAVPDLHLPEPPESLVAIKVPPLIGDSKIIKLPKRVMAVSVGGGGRFYAVRLQFARALALFDVNRSELDEYIELPNDRILFAVGNKMVLVLYIENNVVQRWNLETMKLEASGKLPFLDEVKSIAMGSSSNGPLIALCSNGKLHPTYSLEALDIQTLKSVTIPWTVHNSNILGEQTRLKASADGRTIGLWNPGESPSGIGVIELRDGAVICRANRESTSHVSPSPDGQLIFTSSGIYSPQLQLISREVAGARLTLPTCSPEYLMSAKYTRFATSSAAGSVDVSVCFDQEYEQPLLKLPELEAVDKKQAGVELLRVDERIHAIPAVERMVFFSSTTNTIEIRRLRLEESLASFPGNYLLVTSQPATEVKAEEECRYQAEFQSKPAGVTFELIESPQGMTISSDGLVLWKPQASLAGTKQQVIIGAKNSAGVVRQQRLILSVNAR